MKTTILANTIALSALVTQSLPGNGQTSVPSHSISNEAIRPFQINFPQKKLDDLKRRIIATQWPDKETVNDPSQGVQLATLKTLTQYWATLYNWRKVEARLNALPNFITEIDGLDIHFIHVRSKHKNALPVIITHGWPGSIIEQMKVIAPLTDPTAYGGKAEDAFDVVIPSLPGYGFSGKPVAGGWNPVRIANAWITLMKRLGYKKFIAQGGDWGNAISETMGLIAPPELIAIHTNLPATLPVEISKALASHAPMPEGLSTDEQQAYKQVAYFSYKGIGYALQMGLRPQTLYGLADSPTGLAAWIIDHDIASYELIARVFAGEQEGVTRDDILDNITLYWLTNTAISSARLYWEHFLVANGAGFFDPRNVKIPVAVSVFPDELYAAPKNWAEKAYPKLLYYNRLNKGGHFAAWEQPGLFVSEMRMAFQSIR